jgi:type III pantothenate kinase
MILVIDAGNSRMKWGLAGPEGWRTLGVVPNSEIGTLALRDWQNLPRPMRALGVNVAGEAARVRVEAQLARFRIVPQWLTATRAAGGVTNSYDRPEQLGADRWASLIAARKRLLSNDGEPAAAVVVNAGTAVTVDALDRDGVFRGGVIMPGLALMLRALADNTNALRVAPGHYRDFPTSTSDAVQSGAMHAVCGAIELMRYRLSPDVSIKCFLAGGAAADIAPHLTGPVDVVDNLVLEGVLALALDS